jgi:type III restriction enzyme
MGAVSNLFLGKGKYTLPLSQSSEISFAMALTKRRELTRDDALSSLDAAFEGELRLDHIKKSTAYLSNEFEFGVGTVFFAEAFATSYQEVLMQQALEAHFEKEEENFFRPNGGMNAPRIKTISLFFIDSISGYRDADGWLKKSFEKLLTAKLDALLEKYKTPATPRETEFAEYLQATRRNIASAHGGYFAQDWGEPDASAVAGEREDILHKERTLTFKKANGDWNIRRFFFSKWTLREGWDNPNVFVITKMRTSGSETSKLQEVGRGLRLPVDELGNRLSEEEFRLTYLIDFSERGFAQKLVGEINSDAPVKLDTDKVTEKTIKLIVQSQGVDVAKLESDPAAFSKKENDVYGQLINEGIITNNHSFTTSGYEKMLTVFPKLEETLRVQKNKITETANGRPERPKIKLRVNNWEKIKEFWGKVTQRYMLEFERLKDGDLEKMLDAILNEKSGDADTGDGATEKKPIFVRPRMEEHSSRLQRGKEVDGEVTVFENIRFLDSTLGTLAYGEFLRQVHKQTFIPLALLHRKIAEKFRVLQAAENDVAPLLNTTSVGNFVSAFQKSFQQAFAQKYRYSGLDFSAKTSVFISNGEWPPELEAGVVGTNAATDTSDDARNLYEPPFRFDSELEHNVLKLAPPEEVVVFGKLPRRSIKVPTYTGGTTTPDFVFAIKRKEEKYITLHLVVETKANDLRGAEQVAIAAQKKLFDSVLGVKWDLANVAGDVAGILKLLIEEKQ